MKKLVIGLAVAGLFASAGVILACGIDQKDAADDATPMSSKVAPSVTPTKQATAKVAAKATAKPGALVCAGSNCASVTPSTSVATPTVIAY